MAKPGRKTEPTERKRRRGNTGHRPIPEMTELAPATLGPIPDPIRPLAGSGRGEWDLIWSEGFSWLSATDLVAVQRYCEAIDDYVIVRSRMLAAQADERLTETQVWRLRKQVDDASNRCDRLASVLGLGPSYRADIGVGAVRIVEAVADLMERPVTVGKMTEAFIDAESAE